MLIADINTMLGQTGLPKTYYSWPEDDPAHPVPPLPYIVWYFPNTDNFAADDRVYSHIEALNIELYTRTKDFATEAAVEAVLAAHGIVWNRQESWIESEKMYEVLYTTEVIING